MRLTAEFVNKIIRDRHSTYPANFDSSVKIEKSTIEEILENATWAPTHKLTQPWRFIVFEGESLKGFFNKQSEIYQEITRLDNIKQQKLKKYQDKIEQVSHVIAVIAEHDRSERIPQIEEVVATACALQNVYLSLDAHGIAGYLSTGDVCYTDQMHEFLELNDGDKVLGFFQLGIPAGSINKPNRKRISASEKTIWVK